MTNCKNCGAPLHGGKCEYCGTEYEAPRRRAPKYINPTAERYLLHRYLEFDRGSDFELTDKYKERVAESFLRAGRVVVFE